MADITSILGGSFEPPVVTNINKTPDEQFIDAIMEMGLIPPNGIIFDGQIHRFVCDDNKDRKRNGWYIAYDGRIKAGAFGDWRNDFKSTWREDLGRPLDMSEGIAFQKQMKEAREKAEAERKAKQEEAAESASELWSKAQAATDEHPYLQKKGIKPHGIRIDNTRLVIPLRNAEGEITSIQHIGLNGEKRFMKGGAVAGARFTFNGAKEIIYLAEGFATGASIYEATGNQTVVAFSANQLPTVAASIREQEPGASIVIVADNDEPGIKSANEAARASNGRVITVPHQGMDANDYAQDGNDLSILLKPPVQSEFLVSANDFKKEPQPIRWLIKHHLQEQALIMVHGPSGGGKTFVVLDQILHIASGQKEWLGHKVKTGSVVYLAGEGHQGLKGRIAAWCQDHNVDDLNMWLSQRGTDLNTIEGEVLVNMAIDSLPTTPSIIVVDTLHRFLNGDENSSQDAKTMLDACGRLMERYNCSVLLVHHTGVSEEAQHRARGSSAWRGALDIEFSVVPGSPEKPMELIQRKSKDAELTQPVYLNLKTVYIDNWFDEDGEQVSSAVISATNKPTDSRVNKETEKFVDLFNQAWAESSNEYLFGCKFIRVSPLKEWLLTHGHFKTDASASNQTKPSYKRGMMSKMAEAGLVRHEAGGWILLQSVDDAVSALLD